MSQAGDELRALADRVDAAVAEIEQRGADLAEELQPLKNAIGEVAVAVEDLAGGEEPEEATPEGG